MPGVENLDILIVDDNADIRALVTRLLGQDPAPAWSVREAPSGATGLAEAIRRPPDCLILDYHLPDCDGIEVLRRLRESDVKVPVIMLTSEVTAAVAVDALKNGAADFLPKGAVTKETLRLAIGRAVEKRRLEWRLSLKTAELERSNAELESFAYAVSHDLRAPLRAIRFYAERLEGSEDAAGEPRAKLVSEIDRMDQLISALLEHALIGSAGLKVSEVDCRALLLEVLERLERQIADAGAEIEVGELPMLASDPMLLSQLFGNLIDNALKFRRPEGVRISICAEQRDGASIVSVRDNGIGIDPRHFEGIFSVFRRLHTRSEYPGTGIGLAVCRKIVQLHGGRIWVESQPGCGTAFHVSLPCSRRAAAGRQAAAEANPRPGELQQGAASRRPIEDDGAGRPHGAVGEGALTWWRRDRSGCC